MFEIIKLKNKKYQEIYYKGAFIAELYVDEGKYQWNGLNGQTSYLSKEFDSTDEIFEDIRRFYGQGLKHL